MNRQGLIDQVKEGYTNIASDTSQHHFHQTTTDITPEAYYEKLLGAVISDIQKGTFDNCQSGSEIIRPCLKNKYCTNE